MITFLRRPRSEFNRNVSVVLTGAAAAQIVTLAVSPLLSRLFSPAEFGVAGSFQAISQIFVTIACARYEVAVNLPEDDAQALHVACLTLVVPLLLGGLLAVLCWLTQPLLQVLLVFREVGPWLYGVPVLVVFSGVGLGLAAVCNRHKHFGVLAWNGFLRVVVTVGVSLLLGWAGWQAAGLILGLILGQATATLGLLWHLAFIKRIPMTSVSWSQAVAAARRYRDFPKYLVPSGLVEAGSSQLPTLLFATFYSMDTAGYFSFANRTVNLPLSLLGKSFGDVFRQSAAEAFARNGNCIALFHSTRHKLTRLAIPLGLGILFTSPWLFAFVFGSKWSEAGIYTSILAVTFAVRFVSSPLSVMFFIAEKQKWDLLIQTALFFSLLTVLTCIGSLDGSARLAVSAYGAIYFAKYLAEYRLSFRFALGAGP